jgi:hypothetical protein
MPVITSRSEALLALGLAADATQQDTIRAFRRLSLLHHPDRAGEHDQFITILSAKDVLIKGADVGGDQDGSTPAGDISEWTVPGARPRVPLRNTTAGQARYCAPFLDSLFGPSPFQRCTISIDAGSVPYSCGCDECEQADLYAPLLSGEQFRRSHASNRTPPSSKDQTALEQSNFGPGRDDDDDDDDDETFRDDTDIDHVSIIVISDDEDDLSWLQVPDEPDTRYTFQGCDDSALVVEPESSTPLDNSIPDATILQFDLLSLVDGSAHSNSNSGHPEIAVRHSK